MIRLPACKKSSPWLSLALSLPLLLAATGCAQVQGIIQGVPPGSTQVATFTTAQGQQLALMQLPGSEQYDFYAPGTQWQAMNLPMLNGLTNITFLGSQALGVDTAVFLQAADSECQNRHILLIVNMPRVESNIFNGCDSSLTMIPQADDTSLGFRNSETVPAYYYVYRNYAVYGPIYEAILSQHHYHHYTHKKAVSSTSATPTASSSQPSGTTSQAPIDLDNLDVPANAPAVNLDK